MTKAVAILGSTGSIGRQALSVVADQEDLRAVALAAGSNWQLLAEQARQFDVNLVAIADADAAEPLRAAVGGETKVLAGPDAMADLVGECDADVVLSGVVGACGVTAALRTVERGIDLAIANKETLVVAGRLVTETARATGARLLPVDSEHSAIDQCLGGCELADVRRVIVTASGGPFRQWPVERMNVATVDEALNHPTWNMGAKITIDSATMMNKALEIIEARWLFGLRPDQIDVVIHPESIIHSLVEFCDGSVLAQMGLPDMTLPIARALSPDRPPQRQARRLDLAKAGSLHFHAVDREKFKAVSLAYRVLETGQGAGAVLNGANEAAVEAFLAGRIAFGDIVPLVAESLNSCAPTDETDLEALLAADSQGRRYVATAVAATP